VIEAALKLELSKLAKNSGSKYGVIVHGNRFLATVTLKALKLSSKLDDNTFSLSALQSEVSVKLHEAIDAVVKIVEAEYSNNFLAVLFKNPNKSADVMAKTLNTLSGTQNPEKQMTLL
jgi:hypothetical protein